MNNNGYTIIELVISIIIISIITVIFAQFISIVLDEYDTVTGSLNEKNEMNIIFTQMTDEIRHAVQINSSDSGELEVLAYNSVSGSTTPVRYNYSFINNNLFKYDSSAGDTGMYGIKFSSAEFTIIKPAVHDADTYVSISCLTETGSRYENTVSQRN